MSVVHKLIVDHFIFLINEIISSILKSYGLGLIVRQPKGSNLLN